jgi:outer membrane protein TolC
MRSFFVTVFSFVVASLFAKEMPFKEIVVALDNYNPQIQIARAKIESNQYSMRTERNLEDPSVEYLLLSPGSANDMELVVSQEFAFPTKYARMKKAEKLAYKRDSLEYELTRKEVIASAYEICAEIIYLNQILEMDSIR